jgi:hypothetical protein
VKDFVSYVEGIQGLVDHKIYDLSKKASDLRDRFSKYGFIDYNNSIPQFIDNMQNVSFQIRNNVKASFDAIDYINSLNQTLSLRFTEYDKNNTELLNRAANISQDIRRQYEELQKYYQENSVPKLFGDGLLDFLGLDLGSKLNIFGSFLSFNINYALIGAGLVLMLILFLYMRK